ncbi:hypothetical protein WH47_05808 [Habropoda laboriosa]|uniref:Uncharacterized protein n=1 Tax=Habropoda laboriosa TaxID=597456 RepID=A0A0L7QSQ2_9HYME|nr:hypothetical protein WH47_05808 [Habropoda laboriosa]
MNKTVLPTVNNKTAEVYCTWKNYDDANKLKLQRCYYSELLSGRKNADTVNEVTDCDLGCNPATNSDNSSHKNLPFGPEATQLTWTTLLRIPTTHLRGAHEDRGCDEQQQQPAPHPGKVAHLARRASCTSSSHFYPPVGLIFSIQTQCRLSKRMSR